MLDDMQTQGIIEPVTGPSDWVHPLVVVKKPRGKVRICVDLTNLNRHVRRPFHPLVTPKDAVSGISPKAKYFSTNDATHGYWQVALDSESQMLTTFVTPWGRFKFLRGTMGLVSSGDKFCRRIGTAMNGLPRLSNVVDDFLLDAEDLNTHIKDNWTFLSRCREYDITLSRTKIQFAVGKAKFAATLSVPTG